MREIKFRAWDTESKIMFDWDEMQEWWEDVGYHDNMLRGNHYVPMQYAEIKDKNGIEIYEGDIVKDRWHETIGVVEFSTEDVGGCGYDRFRGSGFRAINIDLHDCEVIGNIFENPELLGGRGIMGFSVDLEKCDFNLLVDKLQSTYNITDTELLKKILLEFGEVIGDTYIVMHNEYWEDGICTWNCFHLVDEVFGIEDSYGVFSSLSEYMISYKEIDEAKENLGL